MSGDLDLDVLVVGGGPAGSACAAMLADGGARVAIVESTDFSRFRIGETIEPLAGSLLDRIGITADDGADWGFQTGGINSVWGQGGLDARLSIMNPYGRGWRVDRRVFDRTLFDHAGRCGATLFSRSRVEQASRRAGCWTFAIVSDGATLNGTTRFVVEATGRNGRSRFVPGHSRIWLDRLVGVTLLADSDMIDADDPLKGAALVEAAPCGWWYSTQLPNRQALAVFFTDGDLLPRKTAAIGAFLSEQWERSEFTRSRCKSIDKRLDWGRLKAFDARSSICRLAASDGWIAAGDALLAVDPLSGSGVTRALNSGIDVAQWLLDGQDLRAGLTAWAEQVSRRFNDYLRQRLRTYSYEDRWSTQPFWRRRQNQ